MRRMSGFRRWQTFRAMDASNALFLLVDWDSAESLETAVSDPRVRDVCERAAGWGFVVGPIEILAPSFDRQLAPHESVTTLLRLRLSPQPEGADAGQESEFALQALAAPGSTRLSGARSRTGAVAACRIDFDTEDGIWHFLESPLRQAWSARAQVGNHDERWAINLPRLEYARQGRPREDSAAARDPRNLLSVQLAISEDWQSAHIRLQGRMDARGCTRCDKLFRSLLHDGCRVLEVDVSGLSSISAEAVAILTRTARALKETGGRFALVDNAARVKRVTRTKHLEGSLRARRAAR